MFLPRCGARNNLQESPGLGWSGMLGGENPGFPVGVPFRSIDPVRPGDTRTSRSAQRVAGQSLVTQTRGDPYSWFNGIAVMEDMEDHTLSINRSTSDSNSTRPIDLQPYATLGHLFFALDSRVVRVTGSWVFAPLFHVHRVFFEPTVVIR